MSNHIPDVILSQLSQTPLLYRHIRQFISLRLFLFNYTCDKIRLPQKHNSIFSTITFVLYYVFFFFLNIHPWHIRGTDSQSRATTMRPMVAKKIKSKKKPNIHSLRRVIPERSIGFAVMPRDLFLTTTCCVASEYSNN